MSSKTEKKSSSRNSKTKKNQNKQIKGYKVELELLEPNTSQNIKLNIQDFKIWCEANLMTEIGNLGAEKICNVTYTIKPKNILKLRFYLDVKDHSLNDAEDYCDYIREFNSDYHVDMYFKVKNMLITKLYRGFKCK